MSDWFQDAGASLTPILPGEVAIPVLPLRLHGAGWPRFAHEGQVGDRESLRSHCAVCLSAGTISEGVELFYVAEVLVRLLLDPGPQPSFQGPVIGGEGAGGERLKTTVLRAKDQDARLFGRSGDDHRVQAHGKEGGVLLCEARSVRGGGVGRAHISSTHFGAVIVSMIVQRHRRSAL